METFILPVLCGLAGILAGFLAARSGRQAAVTRAEVLQARLDDTLRQMDIMKEESARRLSEAVEEKEKSCREMLAAQERRHEEAMKALQDRFNVTIDKVSEEMKSAAGEMLKQRQKEFSESSSAGLGQIVTPLKETIDKMRKAMDDSTLKQTELGSTMKATAEDMIRHSEAARKSTDELARVFRHGTRVQGDWGETVLSELLESQGLTEGIHYDVQSSVRDASGNLVRTDSGSSMRPDVILHLDTKRDVIIDSKVSLSAYMDYVNAGTEDDRRRYLRQHVESVWRHVKELAAKDYSSYILPPKTRMDYVIMFVPHSGALWAALDSRPDLWRKAMEMNVFIADEQTLFAALRIINMTWTQIAQAQNHEKVYALANEMLDRVGQFMKKYESLGKSLEAALKSYEEAGRKLSPSGQSILQTCGKLQKLGARQSDRNPLPQLSGTENDGGGTPNRESGEDGDGQ